jgi:hypothetical protein
MSSIRTKAQNKDSQSNVHNLEGKTSKAMRTNDQENKLQQKSLN